MKLQTHIPLEKQSHNLIDYHSHLLLLGSCFVENIGNKLTDFKFQCTQNPFGILFHPKAIETIVTNAIHLKVYTEEDVFFHNEQWHCYDAHSKLNNGSKEQLLKTLNEQVNVTASHLKSVSHIIITLGTAWVYNHYKTNLPVANCHKVSQNEFVKKLLTVEEVANSLQIIMNTIHQVNPTVTIIFTVSPVRHIKDGFVENTQSKAHLITALQNVLSHRSQSGCFYFPSYEIMLDELRDYRFYAEDMSHPNQTAINYIWEKFQKVWMSNDVLEVMKEIENIQKGLQHRPFNSNSESHQKFLKQLEVKKKELHSQYPHIQF